MALGLKIEKGDTMEEGLRAFGVIQEFRRRFEAEMETINCRELTGMDLSDMSTEEGIAKFMSSDIPQMVCAPAIGVAYRLVVNLLKAAS